MNHYSFDWIFNPKVDAETRKYRFNYCMDEVNREFAVQRLMPFWKGLGMTLKEIDHYLKGQKLLEDSMPKEIIGIDWKILSPEFKNLHYIQELEELKAFLHTIHPDLNLLFAEGADLFKFVSRQLLLEPVGILPVYKKEGLMMIKNRNQQKIYNYSYKLSVQQETDFSFSALHTEYLGDEELSLTKTPFDIKKALIKTRMEFDHVAAFLIESQSNYPINCTVKPAAEKILYEYLMKGV